jgi:hypothetical protein
MGTEAASSALFKALLGYGGLGCLADQLLEKATRIGLQLHVFDPAPQGCRLFLGDGPFGVVETVLESLQMLPLRERISGKSWGYVNGGALLFPFIGVYREARGRVVVFVQAFVGIDMDAFHEGGDGRVGDHAGLEVLEQGCAAHKDVGHAVLGTELGIDTGRIAEFERVADEPVGVGREPDLDPRYLVGGGPARSNGLPRQFGDALGQSAARILLEDGRDESVVPANSAAEGRSILQTAAIEMGVAIDAAEEIDRTGKACLSELDTLNGGFCYPSLDQADGQGTVDVALEAAGAAIDSQPERVEGLVFCEQRLWPLSPWRPSRRLSVGSNPS